MLQNTDPALQIVSVNLITDSATAQLAPATQPMVWLIGSAVMSAAGFPQGGIYNGQTVTVQVTFVPTCTFAGDTTLPDIVIFAHDFCNEIMSANAHKMMNSTFRMSSVQSACTDCWQITKTADRDTAAAVTDLVTYTITVCNNSANRFTPDVPMVVPEINADHIDIIPAQRKRLGTKRGFIAVKSNCSLQSYVPALHPLMKDFGVSKALVCTYQAISGAGKTFDRMPEIIDNVIPYIGGEEEKSEREPLKLWGHIEGDHIVNAEKPVITAQCFRVPVSDGHTAAVFVSFDKKPSKEEILKAWAEFRGPAQELDLPSAPKQFLHYFEENDRPQPKLDRNTEHGMAVCIGRLREDTLFDYKFACMSHNTLRGAAGGAVLLAELLAAKGYFD